jgi:hypothetical protein
MQTHQIGTKNLKGGGGGCEKILVFTLHYNMLWYTSNMLKLCGNHVTISDNHVNIAGNHISIYDVYVKTSVNHIKIYYVKR